MKSYKTDNGYIITYKGRQAWVKTASDAALINSYILKEEIPKENHLLKSMIELTTGQYQRELKNHINKYKGLLECFYNNRGLDYKD